MSDMLDFNKDTNFYSTRSTNTDVFNVNKPRRTKCEPAFSFKGPVLYNMLPRNVKDVDSFIAFKNEFKEMIFK